MENRQIYGPKRIAKHLRKDGIPCGKSRAKRLDVSRGEEDGLKPKRRTKFKKTTNSKHNKKVSPNFVNQDFRQTEQ